MWIGHLSQSGLFLFFLCMVTNLLNFDSQKQRGKVIQCHFSIQPWGISSSKPAFCTWAIKWCTEMLAKMCFATVTAEMATNLYSKVLSILQTKSRGHSVSTSSPLNTKIKNVTTLNTPNPLRAHCLCCCSPRERERSRSSSFPFFSDNKE